MLVGYVRLIPRMDVFHIWGKCMRHKVPYFEYITVNMFVKVTHQLLAVDGVKYKPGKYYTVVHSDPVTMEK